jgi:hypothetical protein
MLLTLTIIEPSRRIVASSHRRIVALSHCRIVASAARGMESLSLEENLANQLSQLEQVTWRLNVCKHQSDRTGAD